MREPEIKDLENTWMFVALGGGSGLSPVAPGTAGSLAFCLFAPFLVTTALLWQVIFLVGLFVLGCLSADYAAKRLGTHDHGAIVIDEWVGMAVALMAVQSFWGVVLAFGLFRLFDIWKPQPIAWVDAKVSGGLGIVLDDVLAGAMAAVLLLLLSVWWPGL